jgi:hypothetical protein
MIDPAAVGPAGRTVRCARCKTTWLAGGPKTTSPADAFADSVIAEAEAQSAPRAPEPPQAPPVAAAPEAEPEPQPQESAAQADDFGAEPDQPVAADAEPELPKAEAPPVEIDSPAPVQASEAPVEIMDAPSLIPPIDSAPIPQPSEPIDDAENFAARRERLRAKRNQARKSSRWTAVVLLLLAFNVALIGARGEVVRYLPQTASFFAAIGLPVNLRNLAFEDVKITKEMHDGINVLVVEGNIVSKTNSATEVPRLRFAARNASGQEVYVWTALPSRSVLGPGESLPFRSRLASPPGDASDVLVRFFNAQDALSGSK